jgi:hypothetical protein
MSSILVRFPDGTKEFRYPAKVFEEGDLLSHDGVSYRVIEVVVDGDDGVSVTVEPDSGETDVLGSSITVFDSPRSH